MKCEANIKPFDLAQALEIAAWGVCTCAHGGGVYTGGAHGTNATARVGILPFKVDTFLAACLALHVTRP